MKALSIAALFSIFLVYGCASQPDTGQETAVPELAPEQSEETAQDHDNSEGSQDSDSAPEEPVQIEESELPLWKTETLKDISTDHTFTLNGFTQPVLVESFAVWCPVCTRQQEEVKKFHELREDVVSVAINTDHNEDEERVLEHIQKNGFDWLYAVASEDFTRSLIAEFGGGIVNAPSAPMFLICPNKQVHRLRRNGVKPASELSETIDQFCQ